MTGRNGRADQPRGLSSGVASDAGGVRGWKAFAAPVAFLLAVTIAVALVRTVRHSHPPKPVPRHTIESKKRAVPARRFYTVAAGDTVAAIAAKTGVPVGRIRALNPHLRPTALFIDQTIRLK